MIWFIELMGRQFPRRGASWCIPPVTEVCLDTAQVSLHGEQWFYPSAHYPHPKQRITRMRMCLSFLYFSCLWKEGEKLFLLPSPSWPAVNSQWSLYILCSLIPSLSQDWWQWWWPWVSFKLRLWENGHNTGDTLNSERVQFMDVTPYCPVYGNPI